MTSVLANLGLKVKMALVVGVFTLLVGVFAYTLLSEWRDAEDFSQKELEGTQFYEPTMALIRSLQLHRGNALQVARGKQQAEAPMQDAAKQADAAIKQLQELERRYQGRILLGDKLADISKQWQQIRNAAQSMPAEQGFQAHSKLIEEVLSYIEWYSDQSNLTLDPEVNTFYLMQLVSFTLPHAIEFSARLRGELAGAVTTGVATDAAVKNLLARKPITFDKIDTAVKAARKANDSVNGALAKQLEELERTSKSFNQLAQEVLDTNRSALNSAQLFGKGTELVDAGYALTQATVPELQQLLRSRIDTMHSKNNSMLIGLVVAFSIALVFTILVIRAVIRNLGKANEHLRAIQVGQLDNRIEVEGSDELAMLLRGISEMQNSLRETRERAKLAADDLQKAAEETRRIAADSKRIADALAVCDTSVMLADANYNIVFMNNAVNRMLSNREKDLSKELPGFAVAKLMGTNMDVFHKNPTHQREMVSRLKEVYRTSIKIGALTFRLTATPLFDSEGKRAGTIVEWDDLTDRLAKEQEEQRIASENLRVRIALDNSSTNTMIADANNNIVFMNSTLKIMMQNAEADLRRDLPNFSAGRLMGANMDIFHKNPAHQQNLIKNLKSTHSTEVKVGGRTFRLTANPVLNDKNERLGTVVEWLDRTQEVNAEREVAQLVAAASAGDFTRSISEQGKHGFFATLAQALNKLVAVANDGLMDVARVLSALARGDLTERITADYEGLFKQLKDDANTTVEKLEEVIARITEASSAVATGANEIAQGNSDLSQRTEEQASSLEETASSMEEMTSTVKQTSDNAQHANQLSSNAVKKAESGGNVVRKAVDAMAEINSSSKKIADIIGVIDEIAFQTNLLALNAAVEAARAGEQGRGFAVVAGEVRNLAQRSAGAAKEIKDLIRDSVTKVEAGTELVNESGTTLADIVGAIREVSSMIGEINTAAQEQTSSIVQINQAVSQMDEMTQQNAALVEQASAAGEAMADQARGLMELMGFFTLEGGVAQPAVMKSASMSRVSSTARKPVSSRSESSSSHDEWEEF